MDSPVTPPKPTKRAQCSRNRTPKLYRWADISSEVLIYFTALWGPWAFGTVHDWAILTINLASYGIGALLLLKWSIRYSTGYEPALWTTQKNGQSITQLPKKDWHTKAVAALTIYMLGYILISILNVRANFNHELNFFEYKETYIKWLPHTYDKSATVQSFLNFLGLACCFWGIRDWLLGKTRKERMESQKLEAETNHNFGEEVPPPSIPIRLNRLLWLLSISGGMLALVSIIQRLDGTPKLLWLYERERFGTSTQSFGPFGYRSNGAAYINMIFPMSVGFLIWAIQQARNKIMSTGRKSGESHIILFPAICMMLVAPFISLSRGGILIMGCMFCIGVCIGLLRPQLLSNKDRMGATVLLVTGIGVFYYTGWESLMNRINSKDYWQETRIEKPSYAETIHYACNMPTPPYEDYYQLLHITDSQNPQFHKALYNVTIYKTGNLRVLIQDHLTKGQLWKFFTNAPSFEPGKLELEISRSALGVEVKANGKILNGDEKTIGNIPPTWSHPIILNELLLYPKKRMNDLETRSVTIHPLAIEGENIIQNDKAFNLQLGSVWNLANIVSNISSRDRIYEDAWTMAKDHKWLGCGAGAWSAVYFLYHDADEVWDAWVHCDWLEFTSTFGLLGGIPGILLICIIFLPIRKPAGLITHKWNHIGLNLGLAGCLVHAVFDFPLQVVSIQHLFVILCAIKMVSTRNDSNRMYTVGI